MPAHYKSCPSTGAGVRKPSKNETAERVAPGTCRELWGIVLAPRLRPGGLVADDGLRGRTDRPTEALSAMEIGLIGG
jgi:hypothetical protein